MPMKLEVLDRVGQVEALRSEWRDLLTRAAPVTPYLTWEWMSAWYATHEQAGETLCLTVREDGRLMGLAPLFLSRSRDQTLPPGALGFASTCGRHWGFHLGAVAANTRCQAVSDVLIDFLASTRCEWHTIRLVHMDALAPMLPHLMRSAVLNDMPVVARPGEQSVGGPLPTTVDRFCSWVCSGSRRKSNRRSLRELARDHGPVTVETCKTLAELKQGMASLRRLNLEQHAVRATRSNFTDEAFAACFFETTRRLWEAGWVQLSLLRCAGEVAAASVDAVYNNRLFCMQPAYNHRFADYSAGHLLLALVVERAIAGGATHLDLLPGGAYKRQYAPLLAPSVDLSLPSACVRGTVPQATGMLRWGLRGSAKALLRRHAPAAYRWLRGAGPDTPAAETPE